MDRPSRADAASLMPMALMLLVGVELIRLGRWLWPTESPLGPTTT